MRMRNKKWARPELEQCHFFVQDPLSLRTHWADEFQNHHPIQLDLGCGKGVFLSALAQQNRNINYLGIDINYTILGLAKRNIEALFNPAPIQNVRLLFFDIRRIELILSDQDLVDRIYINFCNPWPKGKHKKRRLTHPAQLERYKTFLKHGGEIRFKTDDTELFEDSISYFESTGFTITYLTRDLLHSNFTENITTEHEQFFTSQNIPIKFLIARLP